MDNATIVQRMLTAINTFPLLAVIFFVFAGTLMARGGIARTFQNVALFKGMTALDNIMAGRTLKMRRGFFWQLLRLGPALADSGDRLGDRDRPLEEELVGESDLLAELSRERFSSAGIDVLEGGGMLEDAGADAVLVSKKLQNRRADAGYDSVQMYLREIAWRKIFSNQVSKSYFHKVRIDLSPQQEDQLFLSRYSAN